VYTGENLRKQNLSFLENFFFERLFLQKTVLKIISIGVQKIDIKKQTKLKLKNIYTFCERLFLHKIILKMVSTGVQTKDI